MLGEQNIGLAFLILVTWGGSLCLFLAGCNLIVEKIIRPRVTVAQFVKVEKVAGIIYGVVFIASIIGILAITTDSGNNDSDSDLTEMSWFSRGP